MNNNDLQLIYQYMVQPTNHQKENKTTHHQKLINIVEHLLDDELKSTIHLLDTMWYSKGSNKGSLLSSFLQNKVLNYINSSLYKSNQDSILLIQYNKTLYKKID
ncbi:20141_t:CDS:1 [Cetraspora pellucida]|uniref:20141_t:CDS:1 n=1 Tax=Cetraspora pellucida TaxID=1433469 RepID=A0A9N8Z8U4_9GLOM|nr:20141_t:CDS:1 [Cetraspora pellucida]